MGFPRDARRDASGPEGVLRAGVHGPILVGTAMFGGQCEMWNSVVGLAPDGRFVGHSDKVRVLWFGERVPFWEWLTPLHEILPCPGVTPGERPQVLTLADTRVGVLNCYEDVLDQFSRELIHEGT